MLVSGRFLVVGDLVACSGYMLFLAVACGLAVFSIDRPRDTWTISFDKSVAQESPNFFGASFQRGADLNEQYRKLAPWHPGLVALNLVRAPEKKAGAPWDIVKEIAPFFMLCERLHAHALIEISSDDRNYIQETFDIAEFANGGVQLHLGALRARLGHLKPFGLAYVELATGKVSYGERFERLREELAGRDPGITLIAQEAIPTSLVEVLDQRFRKSPSWFAEHADMFDAYPRSGPRIYVSDFSSGSGGELEEAAFLLGMERNSDVVLMASQPSEPGLLLSKYRCDRIVKSRLVGEKLGSTSRLLGVAGRAGNDVILKVVNLGEKRRVHVVLTGFPWHRERVTVDSLPSSDLAPESVGREFDWDFPTRSVTVIRLAPLLSGSSSNRER